ncbi:MAG: Sec-independent protein translocase protein TatB [Pseudomonadota bacterium]|uniref:Sec-independent protein translocase protein TatB n=1 Tax=Sphingomonas sp. ERG5 TaxID=1381597 RepID=UPI00054C4BFF|nr:Sec-independent protein translocase protein TatB [Sphingomonas sp. ERG5]
MFDVAPTELLLIAAVALVVIGPKDLPKAMRFVGYWVGKARGVARQFRSGFDSMVREAELQDMEKRWAAENERIMREHPPTAQHMLPMPAGETGGGASEDAPPVTVEMPVVAPAPATDVALVPATDVALAPAPRAKRAPAKTAAPRASSAAKTPSKAKPKP